MELVRKTMLSAAAFAVAAAATSAAFPTGVSPVAAEKKKVLVFSRIEGFNHKESVAACKEMMAAEAEKGAFAVDFSDDYAALEVSNLVKYAGLVLNNTTHLKTKDHPSVAPSICAYVRWGGGLCVIHAGADNFYDAPDCAHLVGGRFDGHPWGSGGTWAFKVEDRDSPITAPFKGFADGKFKRGEEIYQQASPFYDRAKLHVLVSLDLSDPATAGAKGMKRADRDFAVSWIRRYGRGRVFYTSFAHDRRAWDADDTRAHIFAGLAYAMGTLKADDTVPGAVAQERDPPIAELAADILDRPFTGSDWRRRQEREFLLGAALARQAEKDGAKAVAATARRIFARKDLSDTLRAVAARVVLMDDPSAFLEVVSDPAKKVRQAAFGRGLAIPSGELRKALAGAAPERACAILARLAQDGAKDCVKEVAARVVDPNEDVAAAACVALGVLGSVADVDVLNGARKRGGAVGKAAEEALTSLPGAGEKLFELAAKDKALLSVAAKRAELKLLPRWKPFIASPDAATRKAAWKAFGAMASPATEAEVKTWFLSHGRRSGRWRRLRRRRRSRPGSFQLRAKRRAPPATCSGRASSSRAMQKNARLSSLTPGAMARLPHAGRHRSSFRGTRALMRLTCGRKWRLTRRSAPSPRRCIVKSRARRWQEVRRRRYPRRASGNARRRAPTAATSPNGRVTGSRRPVGAPVSTRRGFGSRSISEAACSSTR